MTPAQLQTLLQQAVAHHRAGRLDQAAPLYRRVLAVRPKLFDAVHLLGALLLQQGRNTEALDQLAKARALDPRSAPCAMRLGLALMGAGRAKEAEPHFRAAVALNAAYPEGWDNLAYCLKVQDRLSDAVPCHERAVALKPDFAVAWYNFGLTLSLLGRPADALTCHERALAAKPDYAKGHFGRAQALQQANRLEEAIAAYDRYLALCPEHDEAHSYRLFALNNLEQLSPAEVFAAHAAYGRRFNAPATPAAVVDPDPERRLRVAILSPDLRYHSCAFFLEPLLAGLDPAKFELYLYHDHFREDEVSARLRGLAAVWRNFVGQPNSVIEPVVRADRPDILVDLSGHTGMLSRLPLFARRVAPVQVTYLGYPNTTGLTEMDYRFTDAIADPVGDADPLATERLVRFAPTAWAYRAPAFAPPVQPPPAATGGPVTFGCFNNLAKITDRALRTWAAILAAVPDSRLLLKGRGLGGGVTRDGYLARFGACGLPAERVDFLERSETPEAHLALYQRIDIALDTFPYNGTTTTCEALWMGRPVLTVRGDRHAARVSASLLTAISREEWIADDEADLVRRAVRLAEDRGALAAASASLRDAVLASPLGDHAGQAARFGDALRACWREKIAVAAPPLAVAS